jgi:hypothetical protein
MPEGYTGPFNAPAATGNSAAFNNFIARTSGLNAAHQNRYATLLNSLTFDGFFDSYGNSTLLDLLYIFATADSTTAKLNLVQNQYNCTYNGTPAESTRFQADHGYTGDGSTVFLDTQFNPVTALPSPNMAVNSTGEGVYATTAIPSVTNTCPIGTNDDVLSSVLWSTTTTSVTLSGGGAVASGQTTVGKTGFFAGTRTSSTTASVYTFISGFQGIDGTNSSSNSLQIDYGNIFVLAQNFGIDGPAVDFCSNQLSAAFVGAALTPAQMSVLATRINAYMQSLGINAW